MEMDTRRAKVICEDKNAIILRMKWLAQYLNNLAILGIRNSSGLGKRETSIGCTWELSKQEAFTFF